MERELKELIKKCDLAIKQEDFDTLMNYYTDDAILVVKPGMIARGKDEIKKAFIAIAKYFNNSLTPTQGDMIFLEAGEALGPKCVGDIERSPVRWHVSAHSTGPSRLPNSLQIQAVAN